MNGGEGNDILDNLAGATDSEGGFEFEANGGPGDDKIYGAFGNDDLKGDEGDDLILGKSGNDEIWGGDGNDILVGGD